MSLINDALKRASQVSPPLPVPSEQMPPLQPVHEAPRSKLPLVMLPLVCVAVIALGIWFVVKGFQVARQVTQPSEIPVAARTSPPQARSVPVAARSASPEPIPAAPSPVAEVTVPVQAGPISVGAPSAAAQETSDGSVAGAPEIPLPPSFPVLRLQAVFYRPSNPVVVINSKSLGVGDKVDDALVVAITRESVTLRWQGETRELSLP